MNQEIINKEIIEYFFNEPINTDEFNKIYSLIIEIMKTINFENIDKKYANIVIEIDNDDDKIYKKVIINPQNKSISINLCQTVSSKYFIAKNLTFYNERNITLTKKLVNKPYDYRNSYKELALKRWKYNGNGINLNNFEEITIEDYTKTIPIYSMTELKLIQEHYTKCLSKNKNRNSRKK